MRMVSARKIGLFLIAASGFGWSVADAATVTLRAVKKNNVAITPTSNLTVAPNDTIEAEIFVSGWGAELPGGVRVFQIQLAGVVGAVSADNGLALPLGWDGPVNTDPCSTDQECLERDSRYPLCAGTGGCRGPNHDPSLGSSMNRTRTDFILFGQSVVFALDWVSLNYRYVATAEDPSGVTLDTGVPRYCGTVIYKISANACGTFTLGFVSANSILADGSPKPITIPLVSAPLSLTVSPCALQLLSCSPEHGFVDARRPHAQTNANSRETMNSFTANFNASAAGLVNASFSVQQIPNEGPVPGLLSVVPSGNSATITLNRRINHKVWTCVRHITSNKRCCFGVLPADADSSRFSQPADTFELIDNLVGQINPPLGFPKCDMDRSNLCSALDILTLIDLLNGADAFEPPYNGATLPLTPDMVIR